MLGAGSWDGLESSTVGRVDTDGSEALGCDQSDISLDGGFVLAKTSGILSVWSVSESPLLTSDTKFASWSWSGGWLDWLNDLSSWLWCWSFVKNWCWLLLNLWCFDLWSLGNLDCWSWCWCRSWSWFNLDGQWAEINKVGLGNSRNDFIVSICSWRIRGWGWVDNNSLGGNVGGLSTDCVSTGRWADVAGGCKGVGHNAILISCGGSNLADNRG